MGLDRIADAHIHIIYAIISTWFFLLVHRPTAEREKRPLCFDILYSSSSCSPPPPDPIHKSQLLHLVVALLNPSFSLSSIIDLLGHRLIIIIILSYIYTPTYSHFHSILDTTQNPLPTSHFYFYLL